MSDTSESTDNQSDSDDSSAVAVVEPTDQAAADVPCLAQSLFYNGDDWPWRRLHGSVSVYAQDAGRVGRRQSWKKRSAPGESSPEPSRPLVFWPATGAVAKAGAVELRFLCDPLCRRAPATLGHHRSHRLECVL